jgi:DUF4097 and DUF4098 domain-containing protein YvlB
VKRKWWIVGILVLLELLVCGGVLLTLWAGRTAFEGVRFSYRADTHVEETVEETFVVDGPAVLDLEADFGDVVVTASDEDEVEVVAQLDLWGEDEEDARRQADVRMTQEGNRITVRVVRPDTIHIGVVSTRGSSVGFEIRVPSGTSLQLVTDSGDLAVNDVTGTAELATSFGGIQVENVSGPVSAQSDSGDITLIGLNDGGDLEAETNFGELILRDITAASLTAHSDSGDVQVERVTVDGALDLETNFGSVTVRDAAAGQLTARSDSGEIEAEGIVLNGPLDLETNFGNVTASGVRATSYRLRSGSGSLTLNECRGSLDLETDFGDIEISNATEAGLTLKTDSGKIYFSGSLLAEGPHLVESGFGKVHLILPVDAAFDLDAETEFGSIKTDFAVTVTGFEKKHLVGEVNGGGPLLRIGTSSGNITLKSTTGESN